MGWPYEFLELTAADKELRRQRLQLAGLVAGLSALLPALLLVAYRLAAHASSSLRGGGGPSYRAVPGSPAVKHHRQSTPGGWAVSARRAAWWLGGEARLLGFRCGRRDELLAGALWALWLLALCVVGTGKDYLHLTKRLGIVGVSQLPAQYLLALKRLNPYAWGSSAASPLSAHAAAANRWHRALGRAALPLLALHAALYLNFYVRTGVLAAKLAQPVPLLGLALLAFAALLSLPALLLRVPLTPLRLSYRAFYAAHLLAALALPPLAVLHAPRHAAWWAAPALGLWAADFAVRRLFPPADAAVAVDVAVHRVPGTDLLRLVCPVGPRRAEAFRDAPGAHVYVSVPGGARGGRAKALAAVAAAAAAATGEGGDRGGRGGGRKGAGDGFVYNFARSPFTVCAADPEAGTIEVLARCRAGPLTRALAAVADAPATTAGGTDSSSSSSRRSSDSSSSSSSTAWNEINLLLEGPYGGASPSVLPGLAGLDYDRVLLVAGGVGAAFALPLYRAVLAENPGARAQMVWAVRDAAEATWASSAAGADKDSIMNDDRVQLFLTGDILGSSSSNRSGGRREGDGRRRQGGSSEMELDRLATGGSSSPGVGGGSSHNKRPDLGRIVDAAFRHGAEERVAVLVCGPPAMARDLRACVGPWVARGRVVWWHDESFEW